MGEEFHWYQLSNGTILLRSLLFLKGRWRKKLRLETPWHDVTHILFIFLAAPMTTRLLYTKTSDQCIASYILQACFKESLNKTVTMDAPILEDSHTTSTQTTNLYDESLRMLWASNLVYSFARLLQAGRAGQLELGNTFPPEVLAKYEKERLDMRGLEGEHGLSFTKVVEILNLNKDFLAENDSGWEYTSSIIEKLKAIEDADKSYDSLFLETFASIDASTQCVYGVVKDVVNKRVTVVFRGSTGGDTRDWETNFRAQLEELRTPKLLRGSLKGKLNDRLLVHRGVYEYIFNNSLADGAQRYDMILQDIKPFVKKEGYKLYVTGHSLGGALSSTLAFKLAGSKKSWIPKPVICINYASPIVGTSGYRTAFTLLEKMGYIRYLRITNENDIVPAIPPISFGCTKRTYKHVGINLRLYDKKFILSHPNSNGLGIVNALRNSLVKPLCCALKYHGLPLHEARMDAHKEALKSMTLEDLYADEKLFKTKR